MFLIPLTYWLLLLTKPRFFIDFDHRETHANLRNVFNTTVGGTQTHHARTRVSTYLVWCIAIGDLTYSDREAYLEATTNSLASLASSSSRVLPI